MSKESPEWYDENKLVKIRYAVGNGVDTMGETGWAVEIDRKKNLYRLANQPLFSEANWGDLVVADDENGITEIVERYERDEDDEDEVTEDDELDNVQFICKDCAQESLGERFKP